MELRKRVEKKRKSLINALIQKNVYKDSNKRQLYELTLTELEDLYRRV
ncbi:Fur-regulated basic protein FbpA [Priestia megaterium]|nr:Fur-regulated basic protein FbpA [Priestia megaterium]QSX20015.1 Fur-regulated basic protein FbpA [Priestia megaterium]